MDEKKEYFVHILNWPVVAKSPEEAAKIAHRTINDPVYAAFNYSITNEEIDLVDMGITIEDFDSEEWEEKDG